MRRSGSWPVGPACGRLLLLAGVLFLSCLPAFAAGGSSQVVVSYDFTSPVVLRHLDGTDTVQVKGLPRLGKPGEPVLPYRTGQIVLPPNATVTSVTVTPSAWQTLPGHYQVEPGQTPVSLGRLEERSAPPPTPPDPKVYGSSDWFPAQPGVEWSVQHWRGYAVLAIDVLPVRYLPAAGKLQWAQQIKVRIDLRASTRTEQGKPLGGSRKPGDAAFLRSRVDNPEALTASAPAVAGGTGLLAPTPAYDYVIITSDALANASGPYRFQDLVNLKQSQGLSATIITTEWIAANYPGTRPSGGSDPQTQIRNFIIDAYNTWGTRFVLLGGDSDIMPIGGETEPPIVPARYMTALGDTIASDLYYSCLDGSFDENGNGIYGEPSDGPGGGEVDLLADVYVGRACVDSELQVSTLVSKTISYETSPAPRSVYMVGEYAGFGGVSDYASTSKDEVRLGSSAHGYTTVGFANSPLAPVYDVSTLYDTPDYSFSSQEMIDVINGNINVMNHLGHANNTYSLRLSTSDLSALTNTSYFVGYTQGCFSGAFDNRGVYPTCYCPEDCITEHLTLDPHGAVAFVANDRYGWGMSDSTDGPSQRFDREFWDAPLGEGIFEIGAANADSIWDNLGYIESDEYGRYCAYELTVFGDPALRMRLGASSRGAIGTDRVVYRTSDTMAVTVMDTDLNLDPAAPDVVTVTVASTTEAAPETLVLTENGAATSTFVGAITLTEGPAAPDGRLQVTDGDTVTVTYVDADDGSDGINVPCTVTARVDGVPPTFAGLHLAAPNDGSVLLAWPAANDVTGPIHYNVYRSETRGGQDFSAPIGSTEELTFRDEAATNGVAYYYVVRAVDGAGNEDANTAERRAVPGPLEVVQSWNMDDDPGWSAEGGWAYGQPTGNGRCSNDPTSGYTGPNVYGYNLDGPYPANMAAPENLTTGPIDCSNLATVVLRFQRWLGVESSHSDHAAIQVSTDNVNWTTVWENPAEAIADSAWTLVSYDLSPQAAGQRTVYLRWQMGPTDQCYHFAGWNIDDVQILGKESITSEGLLTLDRAAYQPAATVTITVRDIDLDQNPAVPETALVTVTSTTEPAGESAVCTELAPDIGKFVGQIALSPGAPAADGQLQVANGDTITVTYIDADDGLGGTNLPRIATARVDNEAPAFAGLSAVEVGNGYLDLHWAPATDDSPPVSYRIYRALTSGGQDFTAPLATAAGMTYRDRAVTHGQSYFYVVRAVDAAGNEETNTVEASATAQFLHTLLIKGCPDHGYVEVDGMQYLLPATLQLPHGTVVSLHAVPYQQYAFNSWYWYNEHTPSTDNPATVTLDRDVSVCTTFRLVPFTLSLSGVGEGTVSVDGRELCLPASTDLTPWQYASLQANPTDDYYTGNHWAFDHWSGDVESTDNPLQLYGDSDKSLTAHFLQHLFGFSVSADKPVVESGEQVQLATQYSDNLGHGLQMQGWTARTDMAQGMTRSLGGGLPLDVAVRGHYAFVGATSGLTVYDISSPAAPQLISSLPLPGDLIQPILLGDYAYVSSMFGLSIVDISNPAAPVARGSVNIGNAGALVISWPYAYIGGCQGTRGPVILAVDISDPDAPQIVSSTSTRLPDEPVPFDHRMLRLTASGHYLYGIDCNRWQLFVWDVSTPTAPTFVGRVGGFPGMEVIALTVVGNYAYVVTHGALSAVDVSDPAHPTLAGAWTGELEAWDLVASGHYLYAPDRRGLVVYDISTPNVPVEAANCGATPFAEGVAIEGNLAYVATDFGLKVVDVSAPSSPAPVGAAEAFGNYDDLAISGRYAYLSSPGQVRVIDMEAAGGPLPVGTVPILDYPRTMAASGPYLYVCAKGPRGEDAVAIVDASDPSHPTQVGLWVIPLDNPGQRAVAMVASGNYLYVAMPYDGLAVVDISDPAHPVQVGHLTYVIGCSSSMGISGATLYLRAGLSPAVMIDVSDPTDPQIIGEFPSASRCDGTGAAASGSRLYTSDSRTLFVMSMYSPNGIDSIVPMELPGGVQGIAAVGDHAFVAVTAHQGTMLYLVDASDPTHPTIGGTYQGPYNGVMGGAAVAASDQHVVFSNAGWDVSFFDQRAFTSAAGGTFLPSPRATDPTYQAFENYSSQDVDVLLQAAANCNGVPPFERTAGVKVTVRPMALFGFGPAEAAPGKVARIPVMLDLRTRQAERFGFSVQLTPQEGAQPFAGPLGFEADPSLPVPGLINPVGNAIAVGWPTSIGQPRTGVVHLGDVLVPVSVNAAPGESYQVSFTAGGASLGADELGSHLGDPFALRVLVKFLVGDGYPLLGDFDSDGSSDDFTEFGDANLDSGDSLAVFDSWSLPGLYPVTPGSIRLSAMDAYPRDAESILGGDWRLSWGDVITTTDRVANPALPRPWRTLGLGAPAAMAAKAQATGGPTISIGSATGKAGSTVKVPVTLALGSASADRAGFGVSITAQGGAAPAKIAGFQVAGGLGKPTVRTANGAIGVGWLATVQKAFTGQIVLGEVLVEIPKDAASGAIWRLHLESAGASLADLELPTTAGPVGTVQVK